MGTSVTGKKWFGDQPPECNICHRPFKDGDKFVDGKTVMGPWGIMCMSDHGMYGVGLGTGRGQKYDWTTLNKEEG